MKLLSLAACAFLLSCSTLRASPLDPPGHSKITKNEAEHIALRRFPGGRVTAAKLKKEHGALVWKIAITPASGNAAQNIAVDAMTGRVVSGEKPKR